VVVVVVIIIIIIIIKVTTRKSAKTNGITDGHFTSVIFIDENNFVSDSVGIYRRTNFVNDTVGIYRPYH